MTATFNYDPYYDDFDEDKNFMRVLFKPGYSIQARELTQLQTIVANQIEKFGNHIFKNGSPVLGGGISIDSTANYIILQTQYNNEDVVASDFLDKTIVEKTSVKDVRAKVIAVDTTTDNPILIVKYLSGEKFSEGDEIQVYGEIKYAQLIATDAVGTSMVASIREGVYYFKGQFVKIVAQFIIVEIFYKIGYSTTTINTKPSLKIGIEFTEYQVDQVDDVSLLDPAQGAFNYQAPGADRYQINTTLSKRTLDSADTSSFFEIVRMVDGVVTKEVNTPIYSEIEKTMARRTYDESGNYTTDPFVITLDEGDSANGMFNVILDPGKAYVGGYEFETIAPTTIELSRARAVSNVTDGDIPTNYESSVVVQDVRNTLDVTTFPQLDIHCVPHASISFSTVPKYNSTKIGTLFANMMRYNDATDKNLGTDHTFTINTFAANTTPITGTIPASTSNTTQIKFPSTFNTSLPLDAYANMYFRITDAGGTSLAPILILSSNTTTLNLASALPFTPSSNTIAIDSDFKVAESLVYSDGTYIQFAGNINTDSKDSITGFASINEPKRSSLIFSPPQDAIKASTISNMDYYIRKSYLNRTADGTGKITITATGSDSFTFAGSPGTISDTQILDNIICFVRSGNAGVEAKGIAANTILSLANNYFTVTAISASQFTIDFGGSGSAGVNADLLITTKINNAENGSTGTIRGKQLLPLITGADLHAKVPYEIGASGDDRLEAANSSGEITYFGGGAVFTSIGATNYMSAALQTQLRTPGNPVSLQIADVYEIVRITDSKDTSANVTTAMLTNSSYDITDSYDFDNGQKKSHYDHATIKLKRGYPAPTGRVYVQYKYLKHQNSPYSGGAGVFTVDSYLKAGSNLSYADISRFNNKEDNTLVSLRSAFDFRPTKLPGSTAFSGALNPEPYEQVTTNYDYYLSRIDQVVVKPTKEFAVVTGQSAVIPAAPPIDQRDMLIYTISIPAYTETVKEIRADFKNHRRFTMSDIQSFDDRIRGLEYYVSLTALEKDAASTKVLDANGLERSKYGILVDNFTSKDAQAGPEEVGYDNRNLVADGILQPASLMRTIQLKANTSQFSGSYAIKGINDKKAMMVSYTSSSFASQPYATKFSPLTVANYAGFRGTTQLFPEFSGDVDTNVTAKVVLNSTQGISNAFNFINDAFKYISDANKTWANDKNSPFAQIFDQKWYKTIQETGAAYTQAIGGNWFQTLQPVNDNTYLTKGAEIQQKQIGSSTSQVSTGTFVTDLAIQPYMAPKQILFVSSGLRPKSNYYSFFDDTDVNKYVIVPSQVTLNTTSTLTTGEPVLTANTIASLAANLSSLMSGGDSYDIGFVVVNEPGTSKVSIINETNKPLLGKYIYGLDTGKFYTVSTIVDHRSATGYVSGSSIILSSDASSVNSFYNGKKIRLVHTTTSFSGLGEEYTITGYVGSTRTATLSSVATTSGSVIYSIGDNTSNALGIVGGAFCMPAATFRSGQRNFRVTESTNNTYDADAISYADKTYVSQGITANKTELVNTVLNVDVDFKIVGTTTSDQLVNSTRVGTNVLNQWRSQDPLAQTFYVDESVYPNGVFLSDVDVYFKAKDSGNIPVSVQIRPTINGTPSSDYWIPESVVTKYPSEVNVSSVPKLTDATTATNFQFYFPVYLKPGLHSLIVASNSPEYVIWTAEKGATSINGGGFVDKQPYMGTLYRSQNAIEFVPSINEDLMFNLNRCKFNTTTPANFVLQNEVQSSNINYDKLRLIETAINPSNKVTSVTHSIAMTTILGDKETTFRNITPSQTYSFSDDILYQVGYRRKKLQNANDLTLNIQLSTTDDTVSPVIGLESMYVNLWENFVDNAEINEEDFTIVASGKGYDIANTITINSTLGTGATANVRVDAQGNVTGIYVSSGGADYLDDFDISYYTHPDFPATIVLNSEYDSSGGPCLARYITKPIRLADGYDAGDLRVFLSANKPGISEVTVFYKILSDTDATEFKDRPYMKMACVNPTTTPSLDNVTFRDYEYRPSATDNYVKYVASNGVTYDSFKTFAIKIVMTSSDPAIIPKVKDLRIIAVPAE